MGTESVIEWLAGGSGVIGLLASAALVWGASYRPLTRLCEWAPVASRLARQGRWLLPYLMSCALSISTFAILYANIPQPSLSWTLTARPYIGELEQGSVVYGIGNWQPSFRVYDLTVSNGRDSTPITDIRVSLVMPAIIRRFEGRPFQCNSVDIRQEPDRAYMALGVDKSPLKSARAILTNRVSVKVGRMEPAGQLEVELLLDYQDATALPAALIGEYDYEQYGTRKGPLKVRRVIAVVDNISKQVRLTPVRRGGTYRIVTVTRPDPPMFLEGLEQLGPVTSEIEESGH